MSNVTLQLSHEQKGTVLHSYGFIVGERDYDYKAEYPGAFMVRENAENTEDDWCIVGDDLNALIDEAFDLAAIFSYFEAVCLDVASGGLGILHTGDK
jgi:hypothetical protein